MIGNGILIKNKYLKPLLKRCLITILIIVIYSLGSHLPLPFVEITNRYRQLIAHSSLSMIGVISGANLTNLSLFSVGLNPFMIAMLIVQILMITKMFGFDALSQSQAEIVQQVLLLSLSIMQSIAFTWSMISTKNLAKNSTVALILTAGSLLVYWLCLMNMRYGIGKIAPIMLVNIINSSISSFGSGFKQLQKINN
ncbi:MAG: accessory Sec system protein translocase subunit SecY2, partial [Lactobacillus sp.]|jgi:preprotein translocase subunit SecY|nr:accessory Sec system protein translocase subunit SecY2 [Lactobacillus sp.]